MAKLIHNKPFPSSVGKQLIRDLLHELKGQNEAFLSQPSGAKLPSNHVNVLQSEFGVLSHDDDLQFIGSVISCAHLDGSAREQAALTIKAMLEHFLDNQAIQAFVIGGYCDEENASLELTLDIIDAIRNLKNVQLCLFLVNEANTIYENEHAKPKCYDVAFKFKEDLPLLNPLLAEPPEFPLRQACCFTSCEEKSLACVCVYNSFTEKATLRIPVRKYQPLHDVSFLLLLPDSDLLEICSTSPYAEKKNFVENTKRALRFLYENPDWRRVFVRNSDIVYRFSEDFWKTV